MRQTVVILMLVFSGMLLFADNGEISELIEFLGDDEWRVRVCAEAALLNHGCDAVAELKEALNSSDEEVRYRAEELLRRIGHIEMEDLKSFLSEQMVYDSRCGSYRPVALCGDLVFQGRCRHGLAHLIEHLRRRSRAKPGIVLKAPPIAEGYTDAYLYFINRGEDGWVSLRLDFKVKVYKRAFGKSNWSVIRDFKDTSVGTLVYMKKGESVIHRVRVNYSGGC